MRIYRNSLKKVHKKFNKYFIFKNVGIYYENSNFAYNNIDHKKSHKDYSFP